MDVKVESMKGQNILQGRARSTDTTRIRIAMVSKKYYPHYLIAIIYVINVEQVTNLYNLCNYISVLIRDLNESLPLLLNYNTSQLIQGNVDY